MHSQINIKEGMVSFLFDNWTGSRSLANRGLEVSQPSLKVRDVWDDSKWNMVALSVGESKALEIQSSSRGSKPKEMFVCMWKAFCNYLPVDVRVRKIIIQMALPYKCCLDKSIETLNHFLSSGMLVNLVWKRAVSSFGVFNSKEESWRTKIYRWFRCAKNSSRLGLIMGVTPVIVTWRVETRRCIACMEDKLKSTDNIWNSVKH